MERLESESLRARAQLPLAPGERWAADIERWTGEGGDVCFDNDAEGHAVGASPITRASIECFWTMGTSSSTTRQTTWRFVSADMRLKKPRVTI